LFVIKYSVAMVVVSMVSFFLAPPVSRKTISC
jgi:hypothetical protein